MKDIKFATNFFGFMLNDLDSIKLTIEPEVLEMVQKKLLVLQDTDDEDEIISISQEILDLGLNSSASDIFVSLNETAQQYRDKGYKPEPFKPILREKASTMDGHANQQIFLSDKGKVKDLAKLLSQNTSPLILEPKIRTFWDSREHGGGPVEDEGGSVEDEVRYANIGLFTNDDPENQSPCNSSEALQNEKDYYLRVNIGHPETWDCSKEEERIPFPEEDLSDEGDWLRVVISCHADDFKITPDHQYLFLPHQGDSWSCSCDHNQAHTCSTEMRKWYIYFKVTTTRKIGELQLEIGFYLKNNLLQSRTFVATVGKPINPSMPSFFTINNPGINNTLRNVSTNLESVSLNIQIKNEEENPRIILVGGNEGDEDNVDSNIYHYSLLSDEALKNALISAREVLKDRYVYKKGESYYSTLDKENHKELKGEKSLLEDLIALAHVGKSLYENVFRTVDSIYRLDGLFEKQDPAHVIQICVQNNQDASTPYLWSLIYDISLGSDEQEWKPCKLLEEENWENFTKQKGNYSSKCPFDADHEKNVICPFGFWGFRHLISEPPSIKTKFDNLPGEVKVKNNPILITAGFHKDTVNWIDDMEELGEKVNFSMEIASDSRDGFFNELEKDSEFVYLMCHCVNESDPVTKLDDPYLKIGNDIKVSTGDFTSWIRELRKDNPDHWKSTSPLVFINACHSVQLQPSDRVRFVDRFIAAHASGVIGTEVSVDPVFANEAANRFFSKFILEKKSAGEAMREMRIDFLSKGNVFGLIYTAYCLSNLRLT